MADPNADGTLNSTQQFMYSQQQPTDYDPSTTQSFPVENQVNVPDLGNTQAFVSDPMMSTPQPSNSDFDISSTQAFDPILEADRFIDMQLKAFNNDSSGMPESNPSASSLIGHVMSATQCFEAPEGTPTSNNLESTQAFGNNTVVFDEPEEDEQELENSPNSPTDGADSTQAFENNVGYGDESVGGVTNAIPENEETGYVHSDIEEGMETGLEDNGFTEGGDHIHEETGLMEQSVLREGESGLEGGAGLIDETESGLVEDTSLMEGTALGNENESGVVGETDLVEANESGVVEETGFGEGNESGVAEDLERGPESPLDEGPLSPNVESDIGVQEECESLHIAASPMREEGEENDQPKSPVSDKDDEEAGPSRRRVLVSDDDDDQAQTNKEIGEGEEGDKDDDANSQVGELIADIFGESDAEQHSDNEAGAIEEGGVEEAAPEEPPVDNDEDDRPDDRPMDSEWDFDVMMQRKRLEKKRSRRRRRDGSIDLYADADEVIKELVSQMKQAAEEDRNLNTAHKPALNKRKMLPFVVSQLKKADLHEAFVDFGVVGAIAEWLAPLPDRSLPALEIRRQMTKILTEFPRLEPSILRQSGIGKAVMLLFKHPKEIKENKERASKLISEWARPIFELDTDFRSLTKKDREQRDYELMPAAKKKRLSMDTAEGGGGGDEEISLRPGDKGFICRARVPQPSTKDYVIRPKWKVEGEFKGANKKSGPATPFDKKIREIKDKRRGPKSAHAVSVSIEGRKMLM